MHRNNIEKKDITESEFYMWRAIYAFSLVDNVLSLEEQKLLKSYSNSVPFSQTQINILRNDFKKPQNVETLYYKITNPKDKERFCILARAIAWCEGNVDKQEEAILKKISCFAGEADNEILLRTRNHPHISTYYQQYAKTGVLGLFKIPPIVEIHA